MIQIYLIKTYLFILFIGSFGLSCFASMPLSLNAEFRMMKPVLGQGKYSKVSLIEHIPTQRLYALKQKTGAKSAAGDAYMKHANLHALWRHLGLTSADMIFVQSNGGAEDIILHEFVDGRTLNQAQLESNFFADKKSDEYKGLLLFFDQIIQSRVFILDLNAKNVVFNSTSKQWEIIDSQRGRIVESTAECYRLYKNIFLKRKWVRGTNQIPERLLKKFFDDYEKNRLSLILGKKNDISPSTVKLVDEVARLADQSKLLSSVWVWHTNALTFSAFMEKKISQPQVEVPYPEDKPSLFENAADTQVSEKAIDSIKLLKKEKHFSGYFSRNGQIVFSIIQKQRSSELLDLGFVEALFAAFDGKSLSSKDLRRLLLFLMSKVDTQEKFSDFSKVVSTNKRLFNLLTDKSEVFLTSKRYESQGAIVFSALIQSGIFEDNPNCSPRSFKKI